MQKEPSYTLQVSSLLNVTNRENFAELSFIYKIVQKPATSKLQFWFVALEDKVLAHPLDPKTPTSAITTYKDKTT